MPQAPLSFEQWQAKAAEFPSLGDAERWREQNGVEVDGLPPPRLSRALTDPRRMTGALSSATVAPAPQEPPSMDAPSTPTAPSSMQEYMDLLQQQQAYANEVEASYGKRFEQAKADLEKRYGDPSQSEMLFALSRALLAPRPYRGFGGTMYNVSQALTGIGEQARTARENRAEALARLQSEYEKRGEQNKLASFELRGKMLKARMDQEADLAKAREPKYDFDPESKTYTPRPGTGGLPDLPKTDAYGNYIITDARQIGMLSPGTKIIRPGDAPANFKRVPPR